MTTQFREQAAPHLEHFWQVSDDAERIVLTILAVLQDDAQGEPGECSASDLAQFYTRAQSTLAGLSRRGLVSTSDGAVRLFSPAFAEWIRQELVSVAKETETFDQWLAGKQGLLRQIPEPVRQRASEVLEKVPARYRGMMSGWIAGSKAALQVVDLIKSIQPR